MGFVKIQKTRSYYKRYQTKFRRRREGKTDFYARKRMITQDVNKYGTPKYRLVVRFSNKRVLCQITYSTIQGDKILCQADSNELGRWGLNAGRTSYAAAYATGLLISRRLLKQLKLDSIYKGVSETNGKDYDVSAEAETYKNDKRPFKAILDAGLVNNTIGNRVFAALKGACDGGVHVPHNTRKFFGSERDEETKKWEFYPEANRDRIFGAHVDAYMALLKEENEEKYNKQFSKWISTLKAAKVDTVEALFAKVHAGIRANPERVATKKNEKKPQTFEGEDKSIVVTKKGKYLRCRKITNAQRKANVQTKIKIALQAE